MPCNMFLWFVFWNVLYNNVIFGVNEMSIEKPKSLLDNFRIELIKLVNKYSGMEMTNAETVGCLEFIKFELMQNKQTKL